MLAIFHPNRSGNRNMDVVQIQARIGTWKQISRQFFWLFSASQWEIKNVDKEIDKVRKV